MLKAYFYKLQPEKDSLMQRDVHDDFEKTRSKNSLILL